jgi:hypothetical protein
MTRWGVERGARTAVPASSVAPTGDSALMPPHSQGAERRTERHAGRTTSRWGLRALVVGGLAGAAWLLTGAAAHAADRDPAPEGSLLGSSLIGTVVDGDTATPAVTRVLHAVARPLESETAAQQHHGTVSVLAVPVRALARPAATLTSTLSEATREHRTTDADTALRGIDRVVGEITGPLRLTDGAKDSSIAPVSAPLTRTKRHLTGLLPHVAMPVMTTPRPVAAPVAHRTTAVRAELTESVPVIHAAAHRSDEDSVVIRRHTVAEAAAPETVRETTPGGDGPAPMQVHLGAVSGIPTTGSGAPTEGGSAAFLPAAVAAGTMAFHRLPRPTDVEVRRHVAEAPTVSPD